MSNRNHLNLFFVLAIIASALGCGGSGGNAALQGSWRITKMATNGEYLPDDKVNTKSRLVLDGNKYIMRQGDRVLNEWTFKVDSSKNPKQLLVSRGVSNGKERFSYLIYKIEGDTLTTKSGASSFPTEFSTSTDRGCFLTVYQRDRD
jgi:uncharacterized protein (TIGR03067 family)